jgi:hypothetical protein
MSYRHPGQYPALVRSEDADRRSDPRTLTSTRRDLSSVEFGHQSGTSAGIGVRPAVRVNMLIAGPFHTDISPA